MAVGVGNVLLHSWQASLYFCKGWPVLGTSAGGQGSESEWRQVLPSNQTTDISRSVTLEKLFPPANWNVTAEVRLSQQILVAVWLNTRGSVSIIRTAAYIQLLYISFSTLRCADLSESIVLSLVYQWAKPSASRPWGALQKLPALHSDIYRIFLLYIWNNSLSNSKFHSAFKFMGMIKYLDSLSIRLKKKKKLIMNTLLRFKKNHHKNINYLNEICKLSPSK